MRIIIALLVVNFACLAAFALDDAGWLDKARECAADGFMIDTGETEDDGIYCLVLAVIDSAADKPADARVGAAVLEAKRKITAFVKGETVSASSSLESCTTELSVDGEKVKQSYRKLEKKIKTKVDALVKGTRVVGQISAKESCYAVCVTCERFKNQSAALEAAQAQYGDEGVVVSSGEASTSDLAKQKAIRGAVEQVLGTVVVGYDKMDGKSGFRDKVFSGTDGVVETYRIISETNVEIGKRVELVAKVSKNRLLDNYSNYMKFLGDPAFYIDSNSPDLASHFTGFFTGMGIRIAPDLACAAYVIQCTGTFRDLKHPVDDNRSGVQLSLRFRVMEIGGNETLIDMKNDPRKSACFVGSDPDRQREICADKAFKQMKKPLHERIQAMVGKLVGRKMSEVASEDEED